MNTTIKISGMQVRTQTYKYLVQKRETKYRVKAQKTYLVK